MYEVFHSHFDQLVRGITQPVALLPILFARKLISEKNMSEITVTHTSDADTATKLLNAVEATMKADPRPSRMLRELCEAVETDPALKHVADSIRAALG